ncbi:MAG: hypothetical protein R2706_17485 [Acidimicrobiales bacterium]
MTGARVFDLADRFKRATNRPATLAATLVSDSDDDPDSSVTYRHLELDDAEAAARLERICHPTLSDDGLLLADEVAVHVNTFHDGNWVAVVDGEIVGISSRGGSTSISTTRSIVSSTSTSPSCIATMLPGCTDSTPAFTPTSGAAGSAAASTDTTPLRHRQRCAASWLARMLPYAGLEDTLTVEEFISDVIAGRRHGPTLSFQLNQGFTVRGLLPGYVDGAVGDVATLIVWERDTP